MTVELRRLRPGDVRGRNVVTIAFGLVLLVPDQAFGGVGGAEFDLDFRDWLDRQGVRPCHPQGPHGFL
jgi:hypothetical protein